MRASRPVTVTLGDLHESVTVTASKLVNTAAAPAHSGAESR